jgi:hypothetical protein
MNVSASTPSSAVAEAAACDRAATPGTGAGRTHGAHSEAFERALRERAARLSPDACTEDTMDDGTTGAADGVAAGAFAMRAETPRYAPAAPPPTAPVAPAAPGATRAAVETALATMAPIDPLLGTGEAEQGWQISLNQPGAAVEVRATRLPQGLDARAAWTLTIASPALPADAMARHVPQLAERLRLRGVDTAHIRIEQSDERARDGKDGQGGGSGR